MSGRITIVCPNSDFDNVMPIHSIGSMVSVMRHGRVLVLYHQRLANAKLEMITSQLHEAFLISPCPVLENIWNCRTVNWWSNSVKVLESSLVSDLDLLPAMELQISQTLCVISLCVCKTDECWMPIDLFIVTHPFQLRSLCSTTL